MMSCDRKHLETIFYKSEPLSKLSSSIKVEKSCISTFEIFYCE